MSSDDEIHLQGAPVSDGIAIGLPFFLDPFPDELIPEFPIPIGEVDREIARYRRALFSSREDLKKIQDELRGEESQDVKQILDAHMQMLEDPMMTTVMEDKIRQKQQNPESVFHSVLREYEKSFSNSQDDIFQSRLIDVIDLSKRVLGHLNNKNQEASFSNIPLDAIVLAHELIPSQTATINATRVSAFITQKGGGHSHAALIARAKRIPCVSSIDLHTFEKAAGHCVIVDGKSGTVIINPTEKTLEEYKEKKNLFKTRYNILKKEVRLNLQTKDGCPLCVFANIGHIADLDAMHDHQAAGVGLFRSEYLFLQDATLFASEEGQYQIYARLLEKARGLSVTVRVFDLGGDKSPALLREKDKVRESMLENRGIRFLLKRRDIFKIQLRALLRASMKGDLRLLLPLVSNIEELREAKKIIHVVKEELLNSGLQVKEKIPLGCMIEMPAAVAVCDPLANESDFLSLGTNDLVQYSLGIDRNNPAMSDFFLAAHPKVIQLIQQVVFACTKHKKRLTLCGEIASSPLFIPLLIGLGIREFSCSPLYIPLVKSAMRNSVYAECCQLAEKAMQLKTPGEIAKLLIDQGHQTKVDI